MMLLPTATSVIFLLSHLHTVLSAFVYPDFNETSGLVFNGAATTTDCDDAPLSDASTSGLYQRGHTATEDVFSSVETMQRNSSSFTDDIAIHDAVFGHRRDLDDAGAASTGCSTRLRLTDAHPSRAGSVWYDSRVPILRGFETTFRWQTSDPSVECTEHVDRSFSRKLHRSCAVQGGDGFAFVIHGDPADSHAMGGDGADLGYGGIANSLAVEFDAWTNAGVDVFQDHISIHSGGPRRPNRSDRSTSLGHWRAHEVADGKVHEAKVQYLSYVEARYHERMTANDNLLPYLKDNGEGRELGTLAVFDDQGIAEDRPLVAIPVNLSLLLHLPDGHAYVGFTASTGRKWERHDILSWEWCDSEECSQGMD